MTELNLLKDFNATIPPEKLADDYRKLKRYFANHPSLENFLVKLNLMSHNLVEEQWNILTGETWYGPICGRNRPGQESISTDLLLHGLE